MQRRVEKILSILWQCDSYTSISHKLCGFRFTQHIHNAGSSQEEFSIPNAWHHLLNTFPQTRFSQNGYWGRTHFAGRSDCVCACKEAYGQTERTGRAEDDEGDILQRQRG